MPKRSPKTTFSLIAILLVGAAGLFIYLVTGWNIFWIYLVSINAITLLAYGFDKRQAKTEGGRVPEIILHLLVLAGGFIGGWLGRVLFRHKTLKPLFTVVLVMSTVLWLVILYFYLLG